MQEKIHKALCRLPKPEATSKEAIEAWKKENLEKSDKPSKPPRADLGLRAVAKGSPEHKKRCAQARKDYQAALRRLKSKQA